MSFENTFSFISLFLKADFVVKFVILILIASSIYSWSIIIEKYKLFKKINSSSQYLKNSFGLQSQPIIFIKN